MALHHLAARRSWVLREVFHGFSEEARSRGFSEEGEICFFMSVTPACVDRSGLSVPILDASATAC